MAAIVISAAPASSRKFKSLKGCLPAQRSLPGEILRSNRADLIKALEKGVKKLRDEYPA